MKKQTLVFGEEKKHSVRYNAKPDEASPPLSSIYVSKAALPSPFPKEINLTLEWPQ